MNPWVNEWVVNESMNQWINEIKIQWTNASIHESMIQWISESVNEWISIDREVMSGWVNNQWVNELES